MRSSCHSSNLPPERQRDARNPNLALVQREVQEARLSAGVQIPDVVIALKRAHRRRLQQLCAHTRLTPLSVIRYQRMLLDKITPLDQRS